MRDVSITFPFLIAKAIAVSHKVEVREVAIAAAVPGRSLVAASNDTYSANEEVTYIVAETRRKNICQTSLAPKPREARERMIKVFDTQAADFADGVPGLGGRGYRGGVKDEAMIQRDVEASDWITSKLATPSSRLKNGLEMRNSVCHHPGTLLASQKKNAIELSTIPSNTSHPVKLSPSKLFRENRELIASDVVPSEFLAGKMVAEGGE